MRTAARLFALFCVALALAGCGRNPSYRYKLTLSLDTPDGVKTGFNVVEVRYFDIVFPMKGVGHKVKGQGIYIDLGPGRRPLIALLTSIRRADQRPQDIRWAEDVPTWLFVEYCLGSPKEYDRIALVRAVEGCTTPISIDERDLPDLVTFADVTNPKSIMLVDPNNLSTTLGPGISWRSMTLETTDDRLTDGISKRLPWMKSYDENMRLPEIRSFNGLSDFVNRLDFIK